MENNKEVSFLFWGCFVSLVATSFGFISRVFMLKSWGTEFSLSQTQLGEIFGAGLWPFAIGIVLFSLVVDRFGYGKAMWFAFACHILSAIMTITATGYQTLYWAAFVGALGNGTIEAVINPAVVTIYPKEKTKWLNILHAGWPGGLVLAGLLTLMLNAFGFGWRVQCALIFLPVIVYGLMLFKMKFPINERVAAGVPYMDMLKEPGGVGIFIVVTLIIVELGRTFSGMFGFETPIIALLVVSVLISAAYGGFVKSIGRPMYIFMLLIMLLLATTELGTDGWIKELMGPAMKELGLDGGWILIYTASIMLVLRFLTGPILAITKLSPLGLLAVSSGMVTLGIVWLSKLEQAGPAVLLLAAGFYGVGQTFFWPTTLGFISERFPKGGALTLNAIAGVGMLGVGILGGPWLGFVQDSSIASQLKEQKPALYKSYVNEEPKKLWGVLPYKALNNKKITKASKENQAEIKKVKDIAKRDALFKVAILPLLMLFSYLLLMFYFRKQGGYKAIELEKQDGGFT